MMAVGWMLIVDQTTLCPQVAMNGWLPACSGRSGRPSSMPEMAHTGEDHGYAVLVRGGDDFFVAH